MNTLSNATPRALLPAQRPPFARHLAALARRLGLAVWNALEDAGQRRAARELLAVAERVQARDPELARSLRAASRTNARG